MNRNFLQQDLNILFRVKKHKNRENVLYWEISIPDWPTGGLYTHPFLNIPITHHTDISLSNFCVFLLWTGYHPNFQWIFYFLINYQKVRSVIVQLGLSEVINWSSVYELFMFKHFFQIQIYNSIRQGRPEKNFIRLGWFDFQIFTREVFKNAKLFFKWPIMCIVIF